MAKHSIIKDIPSVVKAKVLTANELTNKKIAIKIIK